MVLFILTTSFFQSERVRICTSHGAATIGGTALLVSKAAAHLVRPRCLVLYCLPIPAPLVLSRRHPHADGSGVCTQPDLHRGLSEPLLRAAAYVKEARNERKGVEAWMDLYTLYFRMISLIASPVRVQEANSSAIF